MQNAKELERFDAAGYLRGNAVRPAVVTQCLNFEF